jgi:hypothetical protein
MISRPTDDEDEGINLTPFTLFIPPPVHKQITSQNFTQKSLSIIKGGFCGGLLAWNQIRASF